jgi:hypothetical protein
VSADRRVGRVGMVEEVLKQNNMRFLNEVDMIHILVHHIK